MAMRVAGFGVGGTDEARGRGGCEAGQGRALSVGGSGWRRVSWRPLLFAVCLEVHPWYSCRRIL